MPCCVELCEWNNYGLSENLLESLVRHALKTDEDFIRNCALNVTMLLSSISYTCTLQASTSKICFKHETTDVSDSLTAYDSKPQYSSIRPRACRNHRIPPYTATEKAIQDATILAPKLMLSQYRSRFLSTSIFEADRCTQTPRRSLARCSHTKRANKKVTLCQV